MSFWDNADFAFQHHAHDSINDEIWRESAKIHEEMEFKPDDLAAPGAYGAQQAMLPNGSVLPWVPDVLGSEWTDCEAVHVVGMAYAGFIEEFSSNRHFPLKEYVKASNESWHNFAQMYLCQVISNNDRAYYEPLSHILEYFQSKSRFCLYDLSRASLVQRGKENARGKRRDKPLSQKGYPYAAPYCDHPKSRR